MSNLNTRKIIDNLSEYYSWWVDYRHWEFYLNWVELKFDILAWMNFIQRLAMNNRIDMDKFIWRILRFILENYKWNESIIEFLDSILK